MRVRFLKKESRFKIWRSNLKKIKSQWWIVLLLKRIELLNKWIKKFRKSSVDNMKTVNSIKKNSKVLFLLYRFGWAKSAIIGSILAKLWTHKKDRRRKVYPKKPLPLTDQHIESSTFKQRKRYWKCKIINKEMQAINWE